MPLQPQWQASVTESDFKSGTILELMTTRTVWNLVLLALACDMACLQSVGCDSGY